MIEQKKERISEEELAKFNQLTEAAQWRRVRKYNEQRERRERNKSLKDLRAEETTIHSTLPQTNNGLSVPTQIRPLILGITTFTGLEQSMRDTTIDPSTPSLAKAPIPSSSVPSAQTLVTMPLQYPAASVMVPGRAPYKAPSVQRRNVGRIKVALQLSRNRDRQTDRKAKYRLKEKKNTAVGEKSRIQALQKSMTPIWQPQHQLTMGRGDPVISKPGQLLPGSQQSLPTDGECRRRHRAGSDSESEPPRAIPRTGSLEQDVRDRLAKSQKTASTTSSRASSGGRASSSRTSTNDSLRSEERPVFGPHDERPEFPRHSILALQWPQAFRRRPTDPPER